MTCGSPETTEGANRDQGLPPNWAALVFGPFARLAVLGRVPFGLRLTNQPGHFAGRLVVHPLLREPTGGKLALWPGRRLPGGLISPPGCDLRRTRPAPSDRCGAGRSSAAHPTSLPPWSRIALGCFHVAAQLAAHEVTALVPGQVIACRVLGANVDTLSEPPSPDERTLIPLTFAPMWISTFLSARTPASWKCTPG
jgi:hypothetical protein